MKKGMEEKIDDLTVAVSSLQKAVVRFEEVQDVLVVRVGAVEEYMQEELATKKELASFRGEVLDHLDSHTHMLCGLMKNGWLLTPKLCGSRTMLRS